MPQNESSDGFAKRCEDFSTLFFPRLWQSAEGHEHCQISYNDSFYDTIFAFSHQDVLSIQDVHSTALKHCLRSPLSGLQSLKQETASTAALTKDLTIPGRGDAFLDHQ